MREHTYNTEEIKEGENKQFSKEKSRNFSCFFLYGKLCYKYKLGSYKSSI